MTDKEDKPQFRSSRVTALLITAGVGLAAAHDQLIDGSLSPQAYGALLFLVLVYLGRGGDELLKRWFGQ